MEEKLTALIDYGLYDDAIILAEELNHLERDEKWFLYIAKALFHQGFFYRCTLCLNNCSSIESEILKARCYEKLDMVDEAISILERVENESDRSGIFLKFLGDLYMKQDQQDLAKSAYFESFQKDPTLISVRSALHSLGFNIEKQETVSSDSPIHQAIHQIGVADYHVKHHLCPPLFSSPLVLYYQFIYHHDMSNYPSAESNYTTLTDMYPWWKLGIDRYSSVLFVLKKHSLLSSLFNQTHQFEASLKETAVIEYNYKALIGDESAIIPLQTIPSSYVYGNYLQGVEFIQRGESTSALEAFRKALCHDNSDYRIWLGLGDCYSVKKDYEKAIAHYMQCLTLFPQCSTGYCRLAQMWIQMNNLGAAQKSISKGLGMDKDHPGLLLLQAQLLKLQKRFKEAVIYYERVKLKCSLEVSVYLDMAQCYHELGNIPESKRILFMASQVDESNQGVVMSVLKQYEYDK